MDFYYSAHTTDTRWEKDEDGVWQHREASPAPDPGSSGASRTTPSSYTPLFETQAANLINLREFTNATSVSSIVAEHSYDADRGDGNPRTLESDESDSGRGSPPMKPVNMSQTLVGIGDVHLEERQPRSRPTRRLEDTSDKYHQAFVAYKERVALEKVRAADTSAGAGEALSSVPYQLSVFPHDELGPSNGPERTNEERAAICAHIDVNNSHAGENCNICYRPPDYYDEADYRVPTEEESMMSAADVEWRYRNGNYNTRVGEGVWQEE